MAIIFQRARMGKFPAVNCSEFDVNGQPGKILFRLDQRSWIILGQPVSEVL
jgi:hypothetical protein